MKLREFQELNYQQKVDITNHAVCIGGRSDDTHMILLYQLDSFYIEVYYHKRYSYISDLNAFDDMSLLDPYLERIEISLAY